MTKELDMTIKVYPDLQEELNKLAYKYESLVWYARKEPPENKEYWDKTPNDIKEGAFRGMKRVEKEYPDEVSRLQKEFKIGEVSFTNPDWQHGFHSGCLAAFRFALTAMDDSTHFDEEIGEEISLGGLDRAKEEFPELDT